MKNRIFTLLFIFCCTPMMIWANGLTISNISRVGNNVTFDIVWSNSWNVSSCPNNWDAAWVFIKFSDCGANPETQWVHGLVNTSLAANNFGGALEPVLADGSAVGIDAAPNNTGVMLRRTAIGVFPASAVTTVTLNITNMSASPQIDLKVIGAEMVFIPQGSFEVGGLATNINTSYPLNNGVNGSVLTISSEAAMNVQWTNGTIHTQNVTLVPAAFPKGFAGYHIMKYEITEGLYASFLNTIPPSFADAGGFTPTNWRWIQNYGFNRNLLNNNGTTPFVYVPERPHRAQNYLCHRDVWALLDWMALRPLTELEYEKACRGINPAVGDEYAWGNTTLVEATIINIIPENGTEIILDVDANSNHNNNAFSGGDPGANNRGPLRVGIFAEVGDATRVETGASYYGVMELSGNLAEPYIEYRHPTFTRNYGDGILDYTVINTATHGVNNEGNWGNNNGSNTEIIVRGGSWSDGLVWPNTIIYDRLRAGDRGLDFNQYYVSRQSWLGGRGGR